MSTDWDFDDMARLLALEHAFCALALISAGNYSYLAKVKTSDAVRAFRKAIESAVYDQTQTPKDVRDRMRVHLKRIFDQIEETAKHADLGSDGSH